MNQSTSEKTILLRQHISSKKNSSDIPKQQTPIPIKSPEKSMVLPKQLENNSALRDLNLDIIKMLKNSGFLGIYL